MKQILVGIVLLTTAACGSSSDDDSSSGGSGGTGGSGGGSGGSGGSGATTTCGTHVPKLLYTSNKVVRGPAVDDESVFFFDNASISRIPKEGGSAESLTTITGLGFLDIALRVYVDGTKLYYSDDAALWSVDTAGGTPVALAMSGSDIATGISPIFTFDADFIYYGDRVSSDNGDANGTLNKVRKSGGTPTVLATGQAGPGSPVLDGTDVYFINEGTITRELDYLNNSGIAAVPKAGGTVRTLFTQEPNDEAIGTSWGGDLLVSSGNLYFSNVNLDDITDTGEYALPVAGGKPVEFSDCPTLGAFIQDKMMYANCGDRIAKFDLATGAETDLVCFPVNLQGANGMAHDEKNIYYVKAEPDNADGDTPYAIYSVPID
jgi:hypothetical protein